MKNLEIERKFLVDKEKWSLTVKPQGVLYIQGYLSIDDDKVVRVRMTGKNGFITIKGNSKTITHPEYEYAIPVEDAHELLELYTRERIEKTRYRIPVGNYIFEVDKFVGLNEGLLLAEIELNRPEDVFEKPEWLGKEVTGDERYYNAYLSKKPYMSWEN
ncbi:MAG: CYTH domain-containing protein [Bacteroidales bacterium]|jgi:CYTH domain-containing protein|nr:CYTH domain-containing protein [Bacteroidales bacterium]